MTGMADLNPALSRIDAFFPSNPVLQQQTSYSDGDIEQISSLLSQVKESWSRVPRTYIVLRLIGHLDRLDELISLGFTDYMLPVTTRRLPPSLDTATCIAFERGQNAVLTKSINLEKGESGRHMHFAKGEPLPFQSKGPLGSGAYGEVDRVVSQISHKEYARKRVRRGVIFGRDARNGATRLVAEIEILKRLEHKHIVRFIGSYTDSSFIGILMSPIADMDLATYLADTSFPSTPAGKATIRTFFGCLATALEYLHSQGVRHKDIKPQNILIKDGAVLFTDFGLSRAAAGGEGSTSSGPTARTPRYCAPEVAAFEERNKSSDIWSLGCVFLEMLAVLRGWTITRLHSFFSQNGTKEPFIRDNAKAMAQLISEFRTMDSPSDNTPIAWIETMLQRDRQARPNAPTLVSSILFHTSPDAVEPPYCGLCCRVEDGSDGSDDLNDGIFESTVTGTEDVQGTANLDLWLGSTITAAFQSLWKKGKERDMETGKRVLAHELPETLRTGGDLAVVDHKQGQYEEAEQVESKLVVSAPDGDTVMLGDSATGAAHCTLEGHSGWVLAVAFSPDGKLVVSASQDCTVRLWDPVTGAEHCAFGGHSDWVRAVAFSPDGKLVASASADWTVRLWDSTTGPARRTLKGHTSWVGAVAFSPDGKLVASASVDRTVRLWDSATGAARCTLKGHSSMVRAVAFLPDGKLVASASNDRTVRLWSLETGVAGKTH